MTDSSDPVSNSGSSNQQEILAAVGRYGAAVDTLNSLKYSQKHISGHSGALGEKNTKLVNEKNDNLREAQANIYDTKKYKAHAGVVRVFICICVAIIVILSVRNMEYIGTNTANIGIGGTLVVGGIVMVRHIADIAMRDNMDYDSYAWQYKSDNHDPSVYEHNKAQFGKMLGSNLSVLGGRKYCADSSCCGEGTSFDAQAGKCVEAGGGDDVEDEFASFTTIQESVGERIIPTVKHTIDRIQLPLPATDTTPLSTHTDCASCTNY
jgi:hypothetical protein